MSPGTERSIDVSVLGPPEPLVLTLAAVEQLQAGEYLRMRHRMKPCLLYDELNRRGYSHDTRRGSGGLCEVFIWRNGDATAADAACSAAAVLPVWDDA